MSRAYCLTCNEQVHETPGGTCPLGHPLAADGFGPAPWVGFAGDTATDIDEVPMHQLDTSGRPREHAGVGQRANGTPHVTGTVNGASNGHAGSLATSGVAFLSVDDGDRSASSDPASDDLAALLAEALREHTPDAQAPTPVDGARTPVEEPTAPAAHDDADWNELASLAAELHLDENVATDDGPGAPATPAPEHDVDEHTADQPTDDAPGDELSESTVDDLLAELAGDTADPAEASAASPASPPPPPAPPVEDTIAWDAPPPPEHVGSAPTADPADVWAEAPPAPADEPAPAPTVDLSNFTARGQRVGDAGSAAPARKYKRGRKR